MGSPTTQQTDLIFTLLEYAIPVVVALFGWLSARLVSWLKTKTKNEVLHGMMTRLNESVTALVLEAEQTLVTEMKKARAADSPGGKTLTDNEARNVKKNVLDNLRNMFGQKGIDELKNVLGVDDTGLDKFLSAKIEGAVLADKRSSMIPKEVSDG